MDGPCAFRTFCLYSDSDRELVYGSRSVVDCTTVCDSVGGSSILLGYPSLSARSSMDRAGGFYPSGWEFESSRAYQICSCGEIGNHVTLLKLS